MLESFQTSPVFDEANPEGIVSSSPGLRGTSYPGMRDRQSLSTSNEVAPILGLTWLIPHIALVPFHLVLSQQRSQFILKAHFLVMPLLFGDVAGDFLQVGLADGEIRIAALPL